MWTYYVKDGEDRIVLADTDLDRLKATVGFMPQFTEDDIKKTRKRIIDFHFEDTEEAVEDVRGKKLDELKTKFEEASDDAHFMSSLGFEIDANPTSNRDIGGILLVMGEGDVVEFCDYYNEFHEVTKADMEVLQKEVILNGQYLYEQKWSFRDAINNAESVKELDAIEIAFKDMDFGDESESDVESV